MKLTKDIAAVRKAARTVLDEVFAARIAATMQPMTTIHLRKTIEADMLLASTLTLKSSPLLAPEAKRRGIPEVTLARMIRDKAAAQASKLGAIEADRQAAQAAVDAATNPIAVEAILFQYR